MGGCDGGTKHQLECFPSVMRGVVLSVDASKSFLNACGELVAAVVGRHREHGRRVAKPRLSPIANMYSILFIFFSRVRGKGRFAREQGTAFLPT